MAKKQEKGIILVGQSRDLFEAYPKLKRAGKVLGVFCDADILLPEGLVRLDGVAGVKSYLEHDAAVSQVYCAMTEISAELLREIQNACKIRNVGFFLVLPVVDELNVRFVRTSVAGSSLLTPAREPLSRLHNRAIKRLFDLLVTITILLTVFPVYYLYKLVGIKRRQRVPSVVTERCCGPNGKTFNRVSFRFDHNSLACLLNVLTGSMSLVGPECFVLGEEGSALGLPIHLERRHVKSGLTGWARVTRKKSLNPGKQITSDVQEDSVDKENNARLQADIYYVEHWSLLLDVKILFKALFS